MPFSNGDARQSRMDAGLEGEETSRSSCRVDPSDCKIGERMETKNCSWVQERLRIELSDLGETKGARVKLPRVRRSSTGLW